MERIDQIVETSANHKSNYSNSTRDQAIYGYVAPEFLVRVAELIDVPLSTLYGVVTFYTQFRLEPLGKNHIQVCHGTACHLRGADQVFHAIEYESQTSAGEFSVEKVACLGCCSLAPVANVNGKIHGNLTADQARKLVKKLKS